MRFREVEKYQKQLTSKTDNMEKSPDQKISIVLTGMEQMPQGMRAVGVKPMTRAYGD